MNTTITLDRLFHAPCARVYRAFTTADLLDRFWSPDGFTTTTAGRTNQGLAVPGEGYRPELPIAIHEGAAQYSVVESPDL